MALNDAQVLAVEHREGPMMVLAGPGSGKTTVITLRVKRLIEECGVDPSGILVITFTKAAAVEMQERFCRLMGDDRPCRVSFGTFHSVFFRILKYAYRYDAGNIVREEQRAAYVKESVDRLKLELEDEGEFIQSILGEISVVKGDMLDLEHYYAKNCSEDMFKQIYHDYEKKLRNGGLLDFDDMLVMCYELFSQRQDILAAWQNRYKYILIDEFQDINRIQYEIVRMLARPEDNLFIVGDDDQSIYRFRGAKPEIMLGFEQDYPLAKRVLLNVNYRSVLPVVEAAGRLIAENQARFPKEIAAIRGEGKPVITRRFANPPEEAEEIVREIQAYAQGGFAYEDMAVLTRTNLGPRLLIEKLMEYNVPFYTKDALPNLYEHWIAKDILTYVRIAAGSRERSDLLLVINRPKRYVSRDSMDAPQVDFERIKAFYMDKGWMVERIEQLEYDLLMLKKMAPAAAVNYIRKAVGYEEYLKEYAQIRRMKPEELSDIANQLQESAAGFRTFKEWTDHIREYGEKLKQQQANRSKKREGVCLATMHSSKGLEYRVVFIPDANEGVTPHNKAVLDVDMEEERRLFYVAMTRAKDRLHVYYVRERYHNKQDVSRFVEEYMEA